MVRGRRRTDRQLADCDSRPADERRRLDQPVRFVLGRRDDLGVVRGPVRVAAVGHEPSESVGAGLRHQALHCLEGGLADRGAKSVEARVDLPQDLDSGRKALHQLDGVDRHREAVDDGGERAQTAQLWLADRRVRDQQVADTGAGENLSLDVQLNVKTSQTEVLVIAETPLLDLASSMR